MEVQKEAVVLLRRVVREGFHEKVTFEQILERHEGTSCEDIWKVVCFRKVDSKGNIPKTGACPSCSRNSKVVRVAGWSE